MTDTYPTAAPVVTPEPAPLAAPAPEPLTTPAPEPVVAPEPAPLATPEAPAPEAPAPGRSVKDVMQAVNELTALEWLHVVRELDMPSQQISQDVTLAALVVAVVEDARESGFWRWDKYVAKDLNTQMTDLGVDLSGLAEGVSGYAPHDPKSGG